MFILGKRKNQPDFELVEDWIQEQIFKIDEVADTDVVIKLDAVQCTVSQVPTEYECIICSCIAWEPMECLQCSAFACAKCIKKWNDEGSNQCPTCNDISGYKKLNRHLKNQMEQLSFKCKINSCTTTFKYSDALEHIKTC